MYLILFFASTHSIDGLEALCFRVVHQCVRVCVYMCAYMCAQTEALSYHFAIKFWFGI